MIISDFVDTASGSCREGGLEGMKLEVEPGEEAVGVIWEQRWGWDGRVQGQILQNSRGGTW